MGPQFGHDTPANCELTATNRGGMTPSKAPTRRRHAVRGVRMAQNPHRSRLKCAASPTGPGTAPVGAKKLAQHRPSSSISAKKLAQHATKRQFWAIFRAQGELCRAHTHHQTSRAKNIAHQERQRGDIETNNTTARPQQGTAETGITTATEKCTKSARFSPAKATPVSVEARPAPAKVTVVSDKRAARSTGPRRNTRGRRRRVRRAWLRRLWAAAGPGRASRSTTPSRRLACGDLAGGPPRVKGQNVCPESRIFTD